MTIKERIASLSDKVHQKKHAKNSSLFTHADRVELLKFVKSLDCPDELAQWVFNYGDYSLQAAYISSAKRSNDMFALFRESKYPGIVATVLSLDDESYMQWAIELGYSDPITQNERNKIDDWVANCQDELDDLYSALKPMSGSTTSLQTEIIRGINALQADYWKNGFMNWSEGSSYDIQYCLIDKTLTNEASFSPFVLKVLESDLAVLKSFSDTAKTVANGSCPYDVLLSPLGNDLETASFPRLSAVILSFCKRHKELTPFPTTKDLMQDGSLEVASELSVDVPEIFLPITLELQKRLKALGCGSVIRLQDTKWNKYLSFEQRIVGSIDINDAISDLDIAWQQKILHVLTIGDYPEFIIAAVANNPNCSNETLEILAKNQQSHIRLNLAKNAACSEGILSLLAKDDDPNVRSGVALNINCPLNILMSLVLDSSAIVREAVANNLNVFNTVSIILETDTETRVRSQLAKNKNCSTSILDRLAKDKEEIVRHYVAANANTSESVLKELVEDESLYVRRGVASNLSCPDSLLVKLANDDYSSFPKLDEFGCSLFTDPFREILRNPSCPELLSMQLVLKLAGFSDYEEAIAECKSCPSDILATLSQHRDSKIRRLVASNLSCPSNVLQTLAQDVDSGVRQAVARSQFCSPEVLDTLSHHKEHSIRLAVAKNPNTPIETINSLSEDPSLAIALVSNRNCPSGLLKKFVASKQYLIGLISTKNQNYPVTSRRDDAVNLAKELINDLEHPSDIRLEKFSFKDYMIALEVLEMIPDFNYKKDVAKRIKSKDWLTRASVCLSMPKDDHDLRIFLNDSNELIRQLVRYRLKNV